MKNINTYFINKKTLEIFVKKNIIIDNSKLLIQVFSGICRKEKIRDILNDLNSLFKMATIIGTTTDGEINNSRVSQNRVVLSFTSFTHTTLCASSITKHQTSFNSGKQIALNVINNETKLIISFADGLHTNGEEYLDGIHNINKNIIVSGGLAGDNNKFTTTYVFLNDTIISDGAVAVSLSSDLLNVTVDCSFNWKRIGKELTITHADKNRVYTIDNKTAVQTYAHYLGEELAKNLPSIGIEFPLIIKRDGVDIARAIIAKGEDGSLLFAGSIKTGDKLQFGYGNVQVLLDKASEIYDRLKEAPSEVLFIYSCMARRHFLGKDIETEILPLQAIAPVSGFFTYGEFFTSKKKNFFNHTMTVLSLSESNQIHSLKKLALTTVKTSIQNASIYALSHLIEVTSMENIKQKEAFEVLFEKSSDGVLILQDNQFVQCNEKIVSMLGYNSKEEVLKAHPSVLSPRFQEDGKKSFDKAHEMIQIALTKGGHNFEWIHTKANGNHFWVEAVLTPISLVNRDIIHVVWRDISNRKELETQLKKYTTKLEENVSVLDEKNIELETQALYLEKSQKIAHIGVWEYNIQKNTLYWSDEVYKILGLEKSSFSPSYDYFLKTIHPDDREALNKEYSESIREKREYFIQHRIIKANGEISYVEEIGEHSYQNKEVIKTVGVILDVTRRRKLELKLLDINLTLEKRVKEEVLKNKLQEQKLFQQSRLAQMGEMISMIAHQWRQPLGSISSTAANLRLKIELDFFPLNTEESKQECNNYFIQRLDNINDYVKNLTSTIDDFRNFYKPNKDIQSVLLSETLIKALKIIKASLSNDNIEIIYSNDAIQVLEVYENELIQVFLNIFKNAQDNFIEKAILNPKLIINVYDTQISISDNGGGIHKDIIEKIFDPYFSTKDEKNGTGLGLYMSKTIVEDHHKGKLEVFNTDTGVCFKINIGKVK